MDFVDSSLKAMDVTSVFWWYAKFIVEEIGGGCTTGEHKVVKSARLPPEIFSQIHHLPDPTPASDGHYNPFSDVYGKTTTEAHHPSLAKRTGITKSLPFVASVQYVRNVTLMIQCEECSMWRLLYSPRKLSPTAWQKLLTILDYYMFACGATLSDLEQPKWRLCAWRAVLWPIGETLLLNELQPYLYSLLFRR